MEAGRFELTEEVFSFSEIATVVERLVAGRAVAAGISLSTSIARGFPEIWADKRAVKQMLVNLLSNGIKFMPKGGSVTLKGSVGRDGGMRLSVVDNGIGMDPGHHDLVLAPFGQVDSADVRSQHDTGLGLPLVKAMIELQGGHLTLESTKGKGTTLTLCFPAERTIRGLSTATAD